MKKIVILVILSILFSYVQTGISEGIPVVIWSEHTLEPTNTPESMIVDFKEPAIETAVRRALNNQESDLTVDEVASIQRLQLSGLQISDISDLAWFTSLTSVDLSDNPISDLTPLSDLTNLVGLKIWGAQITDISPLSGLSELTTLNLYYNQISDISPLAGLTKLTELDLSSNTISDLTPINGLTQLTYLNVSGNAISDLTPIDGLTKLTVLYLGSNSISNLMPLNNLTRLTELGLSGNSISDLSPLAGMEELSELYLSGNLVSDLLPLSGLANLKTLYLSDNQLSDLTPLKGMHNLKTLYVSGNENLTDVSILSDLELRDYYGPSAEETSAVPKESFLQTIQHSEVGDTIQFGRYEQDCDLPNGQEEIEWIIIAEEEEAVLLLSLYGLDSISFTEEDVDLGSITWEKSQVREWLNNGFYRNAFSNEEQELILTTHLYNSNQAQRRNEWLESARAANLNRAMAVIDENDTEDKVFILSYADVLTFLPNAKDRVTGATAYAIQQGREKEPGLLDWVWAHQREDLDWYLRTPGNAQYNRMYIYGEEVSECLAEHSAEHLVRPALWVSTGKEDVSPVWYPTIPRGAKGEEVVRLQEALIDGGWLNDTADGAYGKKTEEAVIAAQLSFDMKATGVADSSFRKRLYGE